MNWNLHMQMRDLPLVSETGACLSGHPAAAGARTLAGIGPLGPQSGIDHVLQLKDGIRRIGAHFRIAGILLNAHKIRQDETGPAAHRRRSARRRLLSLVSPSVAVSLQQIFQFFFLNSEISIQCRNKF